MSKLENKFLKELDHLVKHIMNRAFNVAQKAEGVDGAEVLNTLWTGDQIANLKLIQGFFIGVMVTSDHINDGDVEIKEILLDFEKIKIMLEGRA